MRVKNVLAAAAWLGLLLGATPQAPANEDVFKTALK